MDHEESIDHEHACCSISRGHAIGKAAALFGVSSLLSTLATDSVEAAEPADNAIVVTLLGTGTPSPIPDRYGCSTLVQAAGLNLVFDTGRGAPVRLNQIGVSNGQIDAVFLTHFHSDHLNGLPDLWMTGYLPNPFGYRPRPLELWGPKGTVRIAKAMRATFSDDIRIRIQDQAVPEVATEIFANEYTRDGAIIQRKGVTVTAFEVNHGPLIKPAYGYRVDYAGRSVVISGDTRLNENVISHGTGADLLIHEVCAAPQSIVDRAEIKAIMDHHTSPEEAGTVFSRAKPRLAAYTHISQPTISGVRPVDIDAIVARTRTNWSGPMIAGTDLLRFVVGSEVTVQRWDSAKRAYLAA